MRKIITTFWLVSALALGAIAAAPTLAADYRAGAASGSMMDSGMMSGGGMSKMKGGMSTEGLEGKKPLKFAPLIDDASVLFGIAYHGDPVNTRHSMTLQIFTA